ncbi:hypothetical protein [Bradyrhizobium sp. NAS96.2]|nr:hypothetical protein [Bradyrhizobium sp. NAS96.2]
MSGLSAHSTFTVRVETYLDAPEFSKFVADDSARLIAAVKKIGKVE